MTELIPTSSIADFVRNAVIDRAKTILWNSIGQNVAQIFGKSYIRDKVEKAFDWVLTQSEYTSNNIDNLAIKTLKSGVLANFDEWFDETIGQFELVLVPQEATGISSPQYKFNDNFNPETTDTTENPDQ